jgi:hypothetical protein
MWFLQLAKDLGVLAVALSLIVCGLAVAAVGVPLVKLVKHLCRGRASK